MDAVNDPTVFVFEGSDFETFPVGGQLTMARSLMKAFGSRLALVGMNRGEAPVGRWTSKEIFGNTFHFFPVCSRTPSAQKPIVPARVTYYLALRRFKQQILSLGCKAAFVQAPEGLLAVSRWRWGSLCYRFAGVESTLQVSRYPLAKSLSRCFDKAVYSALDRANVVLATAEEGAIRRLVERSGGHLQREKIVQLPTCVDTSLFRPAPRAHARTVLGLQTDCPVFLILGRIGRFKGWEFLLDAFERFVQTNGDAHLLFVGDGEDRAPLQARIESRKLTASVTITGFQAATEVRRYLTAADVVLCGSFQEGFSVAMLEALACGKPIVSTDVSGAESMIDAGQNGFILGSRSASEFAKAMEKALHLPDAERVSTSIAARFDITHMTDTLARVWPALRAGSTECLALQHEPLS